MKSIIDWATFVFIGLKTGRSSGFGLNGVIKKQVCQGKVCIFLMPSSTSSQAPKGGVDIQQNHAGWVMIIHLLTFSQPKYLCRLFIIGFERFSRPNCVKWTGCRELSKQQQKTQQHCKSENIQFTAFKETFCSIYGKMWMSNVLLSLKPDMFYVQIFD